MTSLSRANFDLLFAGGPIAAKFRESRIAQSSRNKSNRPEGEKRTGGEKKSLRTAACRRPLQKESHGTRFHDLPRGGKPTEPPLGGVSIGAKRGKWRERGMRSAVLGGPRRKGLCRSREATKAQAAKDLSRGDKTARPDAPLFVTSSIFHLARSSTSFQAAHEQMGHSLVRHSLSFNFPH